ncbi:hypothetical protein ACJRO7_026076 [Eucalyptus globulus]|uniref:Uncharacterized protein n=1 Tax=Eucalyptus globulus TaxID=34317 RepID=A0ABD3KFZ7_EUCGL
MQKDDDWGLKRKTRLDSDKPRWRKQSHRARRSVAVRGWRPRDETWDRTSEWPRKRKMGGRFVTLKGLNRIASVMCEYCKIRPIYTADYEKSLMRDH